MSLELGFHLHAGVRCRLAQSESCQAVEDVLFRVADDELTRIRRLVKCIQPSGGEPVQWCQGNPEDLDSRGVILVQEGEPSLRGTLAHLLGHVCSTRFDFKIVYGGLVKPGQHRAKEAVLYRKWTWEACADAYASRWGFSGDIEAHSPVCPSFAGERVAERWQNEVAWWVKDARWKVHSWLFSERDDLEPHNIYCFQDDSPSISLESAAGRGVYTVRLTRRFQQKLHPGLLEFSLNPMPLEFLATTSERSFVEFQGGVTRQCHRFSNREIKWTMLSQLPDYRNANARTQDEIESWLRVVEGNWCAALFECHYKFFPEGDENTTVGPFEAALMWRILKGEEFLPDRIVRQIDWEKVAQLRS